MSHQPRLIKDEQPEYHVDDAEKAAYRERLQQKLQDTAFRRIEGFPTGTDEDILALSDPPYYTACPNPFLPEIIEQWQQERAQIQKELSLNVGQADSLPTSMPYHREPFATDVSEGKNNPIYNAHSYHTKVPHPAIMRYILHYTDPGDIVFDGFCGTGMTGVAAQLCGDVDEVRKLGYRVDDEGVIYEPVGQTVSLLDGQADSLQYRPISKLGARKAVLNDLSPAATFIAYNYNTPVDAAAFEREAKRILREVEKECGWMYETLHTDGITKGKINYTVWSDVFLCPECGEEMVFWDVAVDHEHGKVRGDWPCPACGVTLSKSPKRDSGALRVERAFETRFDRALGQTVRQARQAPVLINYSMGKKRHEKRPDAHDLALIERIENSDIPYPFPTDALPDGYNTRQPMESHGLTHVHHFYTRRNLWVLAAIQNRINSTQISPRLKRFLLIWFTSSHSRLHKMNRYMPQHNRHVGPLSGTLYISSTPVEISPFYFAAAKARDHARIPTLIGGVTIANHTSSNLFEIQKDTIDYIFVDPPFGGNLMYSELNFLWEAWLGVFTNNVPEAVENKTQGKGLSEYQRLMEACFREFYRILKPGRWMTVEFHNSQNRVWNSIQEALLRAGFMVADVRTLDKVKGTTKQLTYFNATKQDLIISAYKPSAAFEQQFRLQAGTAEGAWAFVRQHLAQLPVVVRKDGYIEPVAERMPYLLFDRMVAFHIQRGLTVPLSAAEFYAGLEQRFIERDGMFFTPDQVPEYDRARLEAEGVGQLSFIVSDEKTAIQWLRRKLDPRQGGAPQTYAEIQPKFLRELHQMKHEALPELADLLEENFLQEPDGRWRVPNPNKASDLEKLRKKALLREFNSYREGKKRLKQFRTEAVRAGFAHAWANKEYATIVQVADRLPERVLQEDPDLLMYYDNASLLA
ncbi:MAG: DNA methyltransferase [Candidatus Promineifilaceae bacterium]